MVDAAAELELEKATELLLLLRLFRLRAVIALGRRGEAVLLVAVAVCSGGLLDATMTDMVEMHVSSNLGEVVGLLP